MWSQKNKIYRSKMHKNDLLTLKTAVCTARKVHCDIDFVYTHSLYLVRKRLHTFHQIHFTIIVLYLYHIKAKLHCQPICQEKINTKRSKNSVPIQVQKVFKKLWLNWFGAEMFSRCFLVTI